jgi:hypothetical protein
MWETRRAASQRAGNFAQQAQTTVFGTMDRIVQNQPLLLAVVGLAAGGCSRGCIPPD